MSSFSASGSVTDTVQLQKKCIQKVDICSEEVVSTGWAKWFWVQSQPGLLNVPHVPRPFRQTRNMHSWLAGDNLNQIISSQCECASGRCVCPATSRSDPVIIGVMMSFFLSEKEKSEKFFSTDSLKCDYLHLHTIIDPIIHTPQKEASFYTFSFIS